MRAHRLLLRPSRARLGFALSGLMLLGCDAVTFKRTTEQVIPVEKGTAIHLETRNGSIEVRRGNTGFVHLRTHRRITPLGGGEKKLGSLEVRVTKEKGVLRIQGRHPADPKQIRYQIDFVATVPPGSPLVLASERGALRVVDLEADVTGRTGDGEVRLQDVSGAVDLRTSAGNIRAVGGLKRLRLETGVGDVTVTLARGSRLTADSVLRSRRGDVTLTLPPDVPATITAETRRGKVSSSVTPQSERPGWLRTLVAGGGPAVSLVSLRGNVRLNTK